MTTDIQPQQWKSNPSVQRPSPRLADYYRWRLRPSIRRTLYKSIRFLAAVAARLLPALARTACREALLFTRPMDCPKFTANRPPLRIHVDSWIELEKRLHSCRKEPETLYWIETFIQPGDTVYDIGANIGAYSLVIAQKLQGCCQVFAFEPSFSNYAQLCRNIQVNGCSSVVSPMFIALAGQSGLQYFNYSDTSTGAALHGLDRDNLPFKGVFRQPMISYRLDEFISSYGLPVPNHIKLDVDGIEYDILTGASNTLLHKDLRSVIVETEPGRTGSDRIGEWLLQHGFHVDSEHYHNHNPFHRGPVVRNVIFVKDAGKPVTGSEK